MWQHYVDRYLDTSRLLAMLRKKFGPHLDFRITCRRGRTSWDAPGQLTESEIRACQKEAPNAGDHRQSFVSSSAATQSLVRNDETDPVDNAFIDSHRRILYVKASVFPTARKEVQYTLGIDLGEREQASPSDSWSGKSLIGRGHTSSVVQMTARISSGSSWSANEPAESTKIAMKQLAAETTQETFLREVRNLKAITADSHPNFVQAIAAFNVNIGTQRKAAFLFSLADTSLEQLFSASAAVKASVLESSQTLWSQFESLAGALQHLHASCGLAHLDITPSNILLYYDSTLPYLQAKISDFGRAISLRNGAADTRSSDMLLRTNERVLRQRDVWQLGAIFTELLAYLWSGSKGVNQFRSEITTITGSLNSNEIAEGFLDDGVKAKDEVYGWLDRCSRQNSRTAEVVPIVAKMLHEINHRSSIQSVVESLQMSCICLYWDGSRYLTFESSDAVKPGYSDSFKERLENATGCAIDWWPLQKPKRSCAPSKMRIQWKWCNHDLSADLPSEIVTAYRRRCTTISSRPQSGPLQTPGTQARPNHSTSGSRSRPSFISPLVQKVYSCWNGLRNTPKSNSALPQAVSTPQAVPTPQGGPTQSPRTIYWCIDESFAEPQRTLSTRIDATKVNSDLMLLQRLMDEYNSVRGWKGQLLSWKGCQDVSFVKFLAVHKGQHEVACCSRELPQPWEYDFALTQTEEIHCIIAAKQITQGLKDPLSTYGDDIHRMIPKHKASILSWNKGDVAWGIHAVSGFSLLKIMRWIGANLVIGAAFIVIWLTKVDRTDLQGAFVPVTFLLTMVTLGMGIPQLLNIA